MGVMGATTEITAWNSSVISRQVRLSNGVRAMAAGGVGSGVSIFTSSDGVTWSQLQTFNASTGNLVLDLFADQDDNLHLIACSNGTVYIFSSLLSVPGSNPVTGTRVVQSLTFQQNVSTASPPRIFAHRITPSNTTDGWTVHWFYMYQVQRQNGTIFYNPQHTWRDVKGTGFNNGAGAYPLSGNPSQNWWDSVTGFTAEMQHIGDGKTPPTNGPRMLFAVHGTPGGANRQSVCISAGAFTAGSQTSGTWAWTTGTDSSGSTVGYQGIDMLWNGSSGLLALTYSLGDGAGYTTYYSAVNSFDANGATTGTVWSASYYNKNATGSVNTLKDAVNVAVDGSGMAYAFGVPVTATDQLQFMSLNPVTVISKISPPANVQHIGAFLRRHGTFGGIDLSWLRYYTSSSQYRTAVAFYTTNAAPTAATPTTPTTGSSVDRTTPITLAWVFNDPDAGDSQSKADIRYKLTSASTWTTILGATTTATSYALPANQAAGNYEWQVLTYDALGVASPWSSSSFFTAADPPGTPVITAPANGGTIATASYTVTWSSPQQDAYEVRRVADNAGSPNTGTVYFTTGTVEDATSRARTLTFDTNNRTEHVQVRVRYSGVWSQWATARVLVSYTRPPTPVAVLTPDNTIAAMRIAITNPTPSGSQPAVAANQIYVDNGDGLGSILLADGQAVNSTYVYRLAVPFYDYSLNKVKVVAVGANGTTAEAFAT